ncbi:MAG: hypothetical protein EZS28_006305 [Streblomastix strix]|uniref:Tc1-like transposase DDE domain-containing protein n=1 Tax=Streblomastix strix TaxID=222440 RepID=A0A5J4WTE1_9EUKA|nr:MAG: hypothetical protein EZS28_006305 [Streblomastix strix]
MMTGSRNLPLEMKPGYILITNKMHNAQGERSHDQQDTEIHQLPQGSNMNAEIFVNDVLVLLITKVNVIYKINTKYFTIKFDNAPSHKASRTKIIVENSIANRFQHLPYSWPQACDYYLFGILKSKLKGMHFTSGDEAHATAINILESIPSTQLLNTLRAWTTRIDYVIENKGQYYN